MVVFFFKVQYLASCFVVELLALVYVLKEPSQSNCLSRRDQHFQQVMSPAHAQ